MTELNVKGPFNRISDILAWFGGARASVLRRAPSERTRYSALGLNVLLVGFLGAVMAMLVASFLLHKPLLRLWPVGLIWLLILTTVDRLLILMTKSGRWLLASIPLRLLIALPVGLLVAEVFLLGIFKPEEDAWIARHQNTQITDQTQAIRHFFAPKLQADSHAIASAQDARTRLHKRIEHFRFLSRCEANTPRCSTTNRRGCGTYCRHYRHEAGVFRQRLQQRRPQLDHKIQGARHDRHRLVQQREAQLQRARQAARADSGLGAHRRALGEVEKRDSLGWLVWLLRLALVGLDLSPVLIKALFLLQRDSTYDELQQADRAAEAIEAHKTRTQASVDKHRIDEEAAAQKEIINADVAARTDALIRRIRRQWGDWVGDAWPRAASADGGVRQEEAPPRFSLATFIENARPHNRLPLALPLSLRRLALISAATAGVVTLLVLASLAGLHWTVEDWWLAPLAVALLLMLGVASHGFRRAPLWMQKLTFGTAFYGLGVLPTLLALNLR